MFLPDTVASFGVTKVSSNPPPNPSVGDLWLHATLKELRIWTGTSWEIPSNGIELPEPTAQGQILVSGNSPKYPWGAQSGIDQGRF